MPAIAARSIPTARSVSSSHATTWFALVIGFVAMLLVKSPTTSIIVTRWAAVRVGSRGNHGTHAGCLDVCPTGALFRTEFGTVVVQQDICNGCGYCKPKLNPRQEAHLVGLPQAGEHSTAELADLFGVARSTVYRAQQRHQAAARP
jgi:Pyruvate/2-oxoacid:ferredoxin oxidoreductase delta subunit